jgi:tetratricopeptide (TPR) repeat protein
MVMFSKLKLKSFAALAIIASMSFALSTESALGVEPLFKKSKLQEMKTLAKEFEDNGNSSRADEIWLQALQEAKTSGTKTQELEMLSFLIRERANHRRFGEVDPYVQKALDTVKPILNTKAYDPEMSVWMDDIADTLYSHGETTASEATKDYCARRYLDVELTVRDRYSPDLIGRACVINTSFCQSGKWEDAIAIAKLTLQYLQRTKPKDALSLAMGNYMLANDYLGAEQSADALKYFYISRDLYPLRKENLMFDLKIALAMEQQHKTPEARKLCEKELETRKSNSSSKDPLAGWNAFVLATLDRTSKQDFRKYMQISFDSFQSNLNPKDVADNSIAASGFVLSSEKLADFEQSAGNNALASSLRLKAHQVRAKHPNWSLCKNKDPIAYYVENGFLPYHVESIPTRQEKAYFLR